MKRIIFFMTIAVLTPVSVSTVAFGQDFSALLEKLDKLEARLTEIDGIEGKDALQESSQPDLDRHEAEVTESAVERDLVAINDEKAVPESQPVMYSGENTVNNLEGIIEIDESLDLDISGFGDIYLVSYQDAGLGSDFSVGQMEVDLETTIAGKTVMAAAIAYDSETETFGLGAFTIDFHLWDSEAGHLQPINGIDHSGVLVGQFDIPFGIDWNVYPSVDRKLVSAPLAVENTHDGWNDYGVELYVQNNWFNGVIYGSNGFSYEWIDDLGGPIEVEMKVAAGSRIGFTPNEYFEIGASYAGFFNQENKLDMSLLGTDVQINYTNFSVKGEYISHTIAHSADGEITNTGYYAQGLYDFGKYFITARYGAFELDDVTADEITRISVGVGWVLTEGSELRFEYQVNSEEKDDLSYLQVVAGF